PGSDAESVEDRSESRAASPDIELGAAGETRGPDGSCCQHTASHDRLLLLEWTEMTLDRLLLVALAVSAAIFTVVALGKAAQTSQMEECRAKASDLLERIVIREQFQTEEDERIAAIRKIYWSF